MRLGTAAELIHMAFQHGVGADVVEAMFRPDISYAFFDDAEIYFVGPGAVCKSDHEVPAYLRQREDARQWVNVGEGRTSIAAALVDRHKWKPAAAAKALSVNADNVYAENRRRASRGVCECCGRMLPKPLVPPLPVRAAVGVAPAP